jgi:hypothetical protein
MLFCIGSSYDNRASVVGLFVVIILINAHNNQG